MATARRHIPFDSRWKMRIDVPYSLMLRDGDLAWSCGQCPLDAMGNVLAPGDLPAQAAIVADTLDAVLREAGLATDAIAQLVVYFVDTGIADVAAMLGILRDRFGPDPLLLPIAVPHFYYDGMLIEIDAHAAAGARRRVDRTSAAGDLTLRQVDAGGFAWVTLSIQRTETAPASATPASATPASAARVADLLQQASLGPERLLSAHWFCAAGDDALLDAPAAAGLVPDPGLAVLAPLRGRTRAVGALLFLRDRSDGVVDVNAIERGGVRLTARRTGNRFWVAARATSGIGSLVEETQAIMTTIEGWLRTQALDFGTVVKSTTHYLGGASASDLHNNMAVRNAYYSRPGPASTGLPVSAFPRSPGRISVDVLGLAGGRSGGGAD